MAKSNEKKSTSKNKKTRQGSGKFSKRPRAGGETFFAGSRAGSPPSKFRRASKPYRGQGR